jgi:putative phage-type endonuclease
MTANLGDRRTYIGASDIAAIIGVSPYLSPIELWQQKVGLTTSEESEYMRAGTVLEDSIVTLYEQRSGYRTQRRNAPYVHEDHPFIQGHVDRIVIGEPGLMDAKASAYGPGYGEAGTDQVPPHIRVQMGTYTGLTGRAWADVALLRNLRLDLYRVEHDGTLFAQMVAVAVDFWHEHVIKEVPPEIDGTAEYRRFLSDRFPVDDGMEMVATPEVALLVDELAVVQREASDIDRREELLKNRLRDVMGNASVLLAPGGKVTWKKNKDSVRTDWELVAETLRSHAPAGAWEEAIAVAARRTEGARVFRFSPAKVMEEAA